ncbi:MAG: serine O-acetyltransferase [Spirochaetaceae bacterium]|nr:serine O-acetyltransferase [Spirochaetaceae bacterium]
MKEKECQNIKAIITSLLDSYRESESTINSNFACQLNHSAILTVIDKLRQLMFPYHFGKKNISPDFLEYHTGELIEEVIFDLVKEIECALRLRKNMESVSGEDFKTQAREIVLKFLSKLGEVRCILSTDIDATFDGDPAANSKNEIISSYPGIYAIMVNRLAHVLYQLDVPLIPRIMTEHAHSLTGIDINPGAIIGRRFFIDHGTGIVIGETTIIGNNVKVYQGVTLGALSTRDGQALKSVKRHPTIEDNVTIYSGASILGGATIIGKVVVIGSNAFVTKSVPEGTRVSIRNPELRFTTKQECRDCLDISCMELGQEGFWDYQI